CKSECAENHFPRKGVHRAIRVRFSPVRSFFELVIAAAFQIIELPDYPITKFTSPSAIGSCATTRFVRSLFWRNKEGSHLRRAHVQAGLTPGATCLLRACRFWWQPPESRVQRAVEIRSAAGPAAGAERSHRSALRRVAMRPAPRDRAQ